MTGVLKGDGRCKNVLSKLLVASSRKIRLCGVLSIMRIILLLSLLASSILHAEIIAGIAKVDVTDRTVPVNDPCYAKALVLTSGETAAVLVTDVADVVELAGRIGEDLGERRRAEVRPTDTLWGWLGPGLIALVGGVLRFWNLDRPQALVFDETYYVKDAESLRQRLPELRAATRRLN